MVVLWQGSGVVTAHWALPFGPLEIVGDGLVLREWGVADLPRMVELFDEASIDRWTPLESPFDLAAANRYLTRAGLRRADGSVIQLAITADGGTPLGELLFIAGEDGTTEMGYSVGLRHRGRRLAARAVELGIRNAVSWGVQRFRLRIEPENAASVAVAVACGFVRRPGPPTPAESKGRSIRLDIWERTES
jgi:RimJ/RimL family protein N-acetyltransferase